MLNATSTRVLALTALSASIALSTGTTSAASMKFGETEVNLGGYVKADVSFTNNGVDGQANQLFVRQNALGADDTKDSVTDLTAAESRIWIKTDTNGFKTHIEGDFNNNAAATNEFVSNSKYFRLRHAYFSSGNWLVGQSWSTFMDLAHLGELLDFGQHASTIFARQNQIRYTIPMGASNLMLALENSATLASGGGSSQTSKRPDIVARYNYKSDWGSASAGVLLAEQYDPATENSDDGIAFSLTAKIKTFGKDDLRVQYNSGALGRYMGVATYASFDGTDAVDSLGYSAAYRHWWSEKTRSNIMYSHTEADDPGAELGVKEANTLHVNFLWDVAPKTRIGVELNKTDVTKSDESEVDVTRLQFSARRIF